MNKYFEETVPEGYKEAMVIDAKSKKFGIWMNVVAFIPIVIAFFIARAFFKFDFSDIDRTNFFTAYIMFLSVLIGYIILHELTHGIVYKAYTKHKLKFGISLTCAYCGVPDIYVYRNTALAALVAPFILFTIIFTAAIFIVPGNIYKYLLVIINGIHIGGCSGDLYVTYLFLTKFKSRDILMNDTGPKQTFYVKEK